MCKCHSLPVYSSSPGPSLYNNIVLPSERDFQLNNTEIFNLILESELIMINWNPKSPALSPERLGEMVYLCMYSWQISSNHVTLLIKSVWTEVSDDCV